MLKILITDSLLSSIVLSLFENVYYNKLKMVGFLEWVTEINLHFSISSGSQFTVFQVKNVLSFSYCKASFTRSDFSTDSKTDRIKKADEVEE